MKTITLKADDEFDGVLAALAKDMKTTKSAVIRKAVINYRKQLEREALRLQVKRASEKVREQSLRICREMSDADNDGLDGL